MGITRILSRVAALFALGVAAGTALVTAGYVVAGTVLCAAAAVVGGTWLLLWARKMDQALAAIRVSAEGQAPEDTPDAITTPLRPLARAVARLRREQAGLTSAAAAAQQRMTHLLEEMPVGIILLDAAGEVRMVNRQARRMLGLTADSDLRRHVQEILPGDVLLTSLADKALGSSTRQEAEVRLGREGERIATATAFRLRDGEQVCLVLQDITSLRQMERVRRDFVANAGHEMRTPAAAIRVLAENLLDGAMNDPEMGPKFLRDILANTERLGKLIADMLELARMEEGGQLAEAVDVAGVVSEAVEEARPLAASAGGELVVSVDDSLRALCVRENLLTALANLLDNAMKYGAEGGRVEVEAAGEGDEVHIRVIDHGPGIPGHLRQRVFERFFRVDKARSRRLGGTGLGLSIVRHAIEQCGGRVWVEETPGGGATFVIALRRAGDKGPETTRP